jgi:hypothetical protein
MLFPGVGLAVEPVAAWGVAWVVVLAGVWGVAWPADAPKCQINCPAAEMAAGLYQFIEGIGIW